MSVALVRYSGPVFNILHLYYENTWAVDKSSSDGRKSKFKNKKQIYYNTMLYIRVYNTPISRGYPGVTGLNIIYFFFTWHIHYYVMRIPFAERFSPPLRIVLLTFFFFFRTILLLRERFIIQFAFFARLFIFCFVRKLLARNTKRKRFSIPRRRRTYCCALFHLKS